MVKKKTKGKKWYNILAPKIFDENVIGRTLVVDPKHLIGRRISLSLLELTNDMNKYYMKYTFIVSKLDGDNAYTIFDGFECLRDYISRMVLRRVSRVDTVQDLVTKDGIKLRVKGLAIISRRAKYSIQQRVRNDIRTMVKSEVEGMTLDEFIESSINEDIKRKVLSEARRIYPVRKFEIRKVEVR
jgi:small subunit ribosomal protein S3Ae